jgi:hypothetical protein
VTARPDDISSSRRPRARLLAGALGVVALIALVALALAAPRAASIAAPAR